QDRKGARPRGTAIAARARRRGDRMSNCVVGSGGSRLPCSTVAEHSVESCDHFSYDGDDDNLGFFVGGRTPTHGYEPTREAAMAAFAAFTSTLETCRQQLDRIAL